MATRPIGTCSICAGPVVLPAYQVNPVASCQRCGSTAVNAYGPVVEMRKPTLGEITDLLIVAAMGGK